MSRQRVEMYTREGRPAVGVEWTDTERPQSTYSVEDVSEFRVLECILGPQ